MRFNIFSIPVFGTAVSFIVLGFFAYLKSKRREISAIFFYWCVSSSIWLFSYAFAYNVISPQKALFFFKIGYSGVIFVGILGFQYTVEFLKIKKLKSLVVINYGLGSGFLYLLWNSIYLTKGVNKFFWGYYPQAGSAHPAFLLFFVGMTTIAVILVLHFLFFKGSYLTSIQKNQVKYMAIAFFIYNFASVDFLPNYGIEIYPFGYFPAFIFFSIIAYTIIRYRFMDITIAITRTGIFIAVYSIVLGIPFALAFGWQDKLMSILGERWWIVPLVTSTVLATAGPFIYLYIQKRAEDRLMQEQRRYQSTLRQASSGMSRIKDLKRLLNLIVHILNRTVHLEHSSVYLYDKIEKKFFLEAARNKEKTKSKGVIEYKSHLIEFLMKSKEPIVYEEIKQRTQDYKDQRLSEVESQMKVLDAELVVPSFVEDRLLGVVVLGKKKSGQLYSQDDLAVFSILANQAALAIENAQFYEDAKKTQEQLFQAEKMATIGTMADGLSHQINNRLHALGFIAGDALDTINLKKSSKMSPEIKALIDEIQYSLTRIQDNVKQGGEIVQGLLRYTRKGDAGLAPVVFDELVVASLEMAQYKVRLDQISVVRDYPKDLPKFFGNFTQLQEVLFNLIDNAYDAIMQRKTEGNEPGYQGKLHISARKTDSSLEISFLDNGAGVKDEDENKLFTPFFTTKTSTKKGTGLGLYVIQKIIEENHKGKVSISSEYMTGTLVTILLPIGGADRKK